MFIVMSCLTISSICHDLSFLCSFSTSQHRSVYFMLGHHDAGTLWNVAVAGVSVDGLSFHARTDARTRVLHTDSVVKTKKINTVE